MKTVTDYLFEKSVAQTNVLRRLSENDYDSENDSSLPEDEDEDDGEEFNLNKQLGEVYSKGVERRAELDRRVKDTVYREDGGNYFIRYCNSQSDDLVKQVNYEFFAEKYGWLHRFTSRLGFDYYLCVNEFSSLEDWLGTIDDDEWDSFIYDLDELSRYPVMDEDRLHALVMEIQDKWMKDDGHVEFVRRLVFTATDGYSAFVYSKIPSSLMWDICREFDRYPEMEGDSCYMDMESLADNPDVKEFIFDNMPTFKKAWLSTKLKVFKQVENQFETGLNKLAEQDETLAAVNARLTSDSLRQLFLEAFPDDSTKSGIAWCLFNTRRALRKTEAPEWGLYVGDPKLAPDKALESTLAAVKSLLDSERFIALYRNWFNRGPREHPEFKFENLQEAEEGSLDDPDESPEDFLDRRVKGYSYTTVYEDNVILVEQAERPSDVELYGNEGEDEEVWTDHEASGGLLPYAVHVKGPYASDYPDSASRCTSFIFVNALTGVVSALSGVSLDVLFSRNRTVGKSVNRAFRKIIYRAILDYDGDNSGLCSILSSLGAVSFLYGLHKRAKLPANLRVKLASELVSKKQWRKAARVLDIDPNNYTEDGFFVRFSSHDIDDFFDSDYRHVVNDVLNGDYGDIDQAYYGLKLDDVWDTLSLPDEARAHLRSILVNRVLWFPDAGDNKRGGYVIVSSDLLDDYDDDEIFRWILNPCDEDKEALKDIRAALLEDAYNMLEVASARNLYVELIAAAADSAGAYKWDEALSKTNTTVYRFYFRWKSVRSMWQSWDDSVDYEDIEQLVKTASSHDSFNIEDHLASVSDVTDDDIKDNLYNFYALEAPNPPYGHPNYLDPKQQTFNFGESLEEEPADVISSMPDVPSELFKSEFEQLIKSKAAFTGASVSDFTYESEVTDSAVICIARVALGTPLGIKTPFVEAISGSVPLLCEKHYGASRKVEVALLDSIAVPVPSIVFHMLFHF